MRIVKYSLFIIFIAIGISTAINLRNFDKLKENTNRVNIILFGDGGTGTQKQYDVAKSADRLCNQNNCNAFFILGDVIYDNGVTSIDDPQFKTKFEDVYKNIDKPFYIALGNHDYDGCTLCYIAYSTISGKWRLPNYYYTQSFGSLVDVITLDTNNLNQTQFDWALTTLKQSHARWKIVIGHHPLLSSDVEHGNATGATKDMLEKIICHNADAYISGHAHDLEDAGSFCGSHFFVSGGGGNKLYDKSLGKNPPFFAKKNGFLLASIDNNRMVFSFFDDTGEQLYSVPLYK